MTQTSGHLPPVDGELWSLVEALVEGTATASERDRLETRLRAEPGTRLFYVSYLDLHAHLQWRMRGEAAAPVGSGQPLSLEQPPAKESDLQVLTRRRPRRAPIRSWWRGVMAASLVAAAAVLALLAYRPGSDEGESPNLPDAPPGSVAVLIDNLEAEWEHDTELPTATGSPLTPGRLKLKSGVVEVAFRGGGNVLLEGPADFDVSAPDRGYLHRGKMTAKVPPGAAAFQVGSLGIVVTDRCGECGLVRDDSGFTEVHVFEGQVGARPAGGHGQVWPGTPLTEKAGVRVDSAGQTLTSVPLNESVFAHLRPEIRVADTTVRGGIYADRNLGTAGRLGVKNSIPDFCWESYLRFDLSGLRGTVSEARVRLVAVRVGQPVVNAAAVVADNQWGETALTWDTKPATGPIVATWTAEEGNAVEFDVTWLVQEALAGDKMLSLCIFAPNRKRGNSFVEYGSRRGDPESRPQLLVTIAP
jgi:hypothetical protein